MKFLLVSAFVLTLCGCSYNGVRGKSVTITGYVKKPGMYKIIGRPDFLDLANLAGGIMLEGYHSTNGPKKIVIIRDNPKTNYGVDQIPLNKKQWQEFDLKPKDRIHFVRE